MNAVSQQEFSPRPRILFVDDSRLMRMCATKVLEESFELVLAESAEAAWELLEQDEHIQVLFTDLRMPGKSGFDLLDQVRSSDQPRLAELPVILITGAEDREELRAQALERGASDFISKPFQAPELLARASAHADSVQSRREVRALERDHHLDRETSLGNRRYCAQRLGQAMSFAVRHNQELTLMHLHLDGLTRLLDELGEPYASRARQRVGQTLSESIRREDTVYRTGPESFTFILPATSADGARHLQDRFTPDLADLGLTGSEQTLQVRARFSVQPLPIDDSRDVNELLKSGLSGAAEPAPATAQHESVGHQDEPGLEEALEWIARGQADRVRQHLPRIRKQLAPLLDLIEESN
ncbi:response regulator [Wenzhouxiangella sp. AB-CW3]|uniref:GGDEF domain-containing response regulator n=1 Tax=Wenzhouxiangella sp. AB-CW3 TaxID=2771012 RepID=UPI00168BCC61|nr:response regulator [Wenzhouxiangella sp. AB-CW3]QOC22112.1 response regulator [Wenzhouxiangella sp. AB-CW3]